MASSLREYLEEKGMEHTRGKPYRPQTQGKIERYHGSMKNIVKLCNYYAPSELEQEIGCFIECYNHERAHESLDKPTPGDVYLGRYRKILTARQRVKEQKIRCRRRINRGLAPKEGGARPLVTLPGSVLHGVKLKCLIPVDEAKEPYVQCHPAVP